MKQIQPVVFPLNQGTATILNLIGINDNLIDTAVFIYQLYTETNILLQANNLTMDGFDYQAYSTSPDSNAYAYSWAATKLGVILI
jgi:hypothetical protein